MWNRHLPRQLLCFCCGISLLRTETVDSSDKEFSESWAIYSRVRVSCAEYGCAKRGSKYGDGFPRPAERVEERPESPVVEQKRAMPKMVSARSGPAGLGSVAVSWLRSLLSVPRLHRWPAALRSPHFPVQKTLMDGWYNLTKALRRDDREHDDDQGFDDGSAGPVLPTTQDVSMAVNNILTGVSQMAGIGSAQMTEVLVRLHQLVLVERLSFMDWVGVLGVPVLLVALIVQKLSVSVDIIVNVILAVIAIFAIGALPHLQQLQLSTEPPLLTQF